MTPARVIVTLLQVIGVVGLAPLLVGVMRTVRSRLEGRHGPPVTQPWRDLRKLTGKQRMRATTTSWVFGAAPAVLVATALLVAGIVPFVTTRSALDQVGDLFVVVYLLLFGSVFLALAGLDAGTAFGGMGSSREMTIVALAEPALLLGIVALAIRGGSSNLASIVATTVHDPESVLTPAGVLAFGALAVVVLAETGRLPFDNPSTHLELTMVHEAMVLEYAGPDLAMVELAAQLRLTVFLGLLANLFLPWGIATTTRPLDVTLAAVAVVLKLVVLAVTVAAGEVFMAKLRLFRVPELLAAGFVLAFLAATASFVLP